MQALEHLGLADEVAAAGCVVERTELRAWNGKVLGTLPVGELSRRAGQPSVVIRRGRLLEILARASEGIAIHYGCRCVGFRQTEAVVHMAFEGGPREHADVLVGADGLHSGIRGQLVGIEQARATHQVAWVGMAPITSPVLPLGATVATMGRGLRFAAAAAGEGETFWHATVPEPSAGRPRSKAELAALYRDGHEPMAALIDSTDAGAIWRTSIMDRRPLVHHGRGRVTLVGDAAHPMAPDLGQGACQGLEDAVMLARSLYDHPDVAAATGSFEQHRRSRTARIVELAHATAVLGMVEHPSWCAARDLGLRTILPTLAREHLRWLLDAGVGHCPTRS